MRIKVILIKVIALLILTVKVSGKDKVQIKN